MSNETTTCAALTLAGLPCKKVKKGESNFCTTHKNYKLSDENKFGNKPKIKDEKPKPPNWFKRQYIKIRAWLWRNQL